MISVAAKMLGIGTHTLRYYEKIGIIEPARTKGRIRLYSDRDIARVKQLKMLMEELGIGLAGAEVILRMAERINQLQRHVNDLESELNRFKYEEQ